jgi:hypothetical protein
VSLIAKNGVHEVVAVDADAKGVTVNEDHVAVEDDQDREVRQDREDVPDPEVRQDHADVQDPEVRQDHADVQVLEDLKVLEVDPGHEAREDAKANAGPEVLEAAEDRKDAEANVVPKVAKENQAAEVLKDAKAIVVPKVAKENPDAEVLKDAKASVDAEDLEDRAANLDISIAVR